MNKMTEIIRERLFSHQDLKYRDFHSALMPTVDKDLVIGVRTPELRKLAKKLAKDPEITVFLADLPHKYYEENNLHGMIIEMEKDFVKCMDMLEDFLPYIDNWATCDLISPKIFRKYTAQLLEKIKVWIQSDHTYTCRFAMKMLMTWYLDEEFSLEYPEMVAAVDSEEYYVNMMRAWYFATALAKQYESVVPFIENKRLDDWTHNKTIQKSVESFRIIPQQKAYLKTFKVRA
ncbi:MAG: DNA alkylation repair protein [Firmicutes bacterium]|nr:DNA alkylation repair protein [Bacillota bacterium]